MAERYSFTTDKTFLPSIAADESVIWNQYHLNNTTLGDTINEGYVTAEEDSPSQYLSVLDSPNEISLDNLNAALTNPKLEVDNENLISEVLTEEIEEDVSEQVYIVSVEGSDEIYGIQVLQDEEGNLRKYQFQFRTNEEGQLEAIPETVQVLPMETEEVNTDVIDQDQVVDNTEENFIEQHTGMHIFVQQDNSDEHILPDQTDQIAEDPEVAEDESTITYENEELEDVVETKAGILSFKQEIQEHLEYESGAVEEPETDVSFDEPHHDFGEPQQDFEEPQDDFEEPQQDFEGAQQDFEEPQQDFVEPQKDFEEPQQDVIEEHQQQEFEEQQQEFDEPEHDFDESEQHFGESHPDPEDHHQEEESRDGLAEEISNTELETETQMYQEQTDDDFEQVEVHPDVNFPEDEIQMTESNEADDVDDFQVVEGLHITGDLEDNIIADKSVSDAISNMKILRHNVNIPKETLRLRRDNKILLYVLKDPEKENLHTDLSGNTHKVHPRSVLKTSHSVFHGKSDIGTESNDLTLNKRFCRGKEAVQARMLHNFINKTTIPQAPVRKDRLPRKQQIKPVERMDEEIVVQEVIVSSNGYMEAINRQNKENLQVTDYVELSDSDDDYDPKKLTNKKKKKHKKKKIEIVISDDDEDEEENGSVIELDESDEETEASPPEAPIDANSETSPKRKRGRPPKNRLSNIESPLKKLKIDENLQKTEIPCPKCDKTFPSQNSLKTHLQHHNVQSSLKNALPTTYKHKCDQCGVSFKNSFLLNRHKCPKICPVCKKKFDEESAFNSHKRIHVKEQLLKSTTTVVRVSPRKVNPPPAFKAPSKVSNLKCKTCGKLCSSLLTLNIHVKSHQTYMCATCKATFVSKILLDKHLTESCVKSPQRRSLRLANEPKIALSNAKANCDKCSLKFSTYKALFQHNVVAHGLETPDKSVLEKKKTLHKAKAVHGGIPANKRLRAAYAEFTSQLQNLK